MRSFGRSLRRAAQLEENQGRKESADENQLRVESVERIRDVSKRGHGESSSDAQTQQPPGR
jgi:hypothetical protein